MKAFWLIGSNQKLKIIDPKQFGNQRGLSTTHLLSLLDTIYKNLENPDDLISLLLIDLEKAFDLINPNVFVEKLLKDFMLTQTLLQ